MRGIFSWRGAGLAVATMLLCLLAVAPAGARSFRIARYQGRQLQLVLPLVADHQGLSSFASDVATPGSSSFRRYASIAQLSRRFGATAAHRARVLAFLRAAGARSARIDATGLFADATMTVAQAERAFDTRIAVRRRAGRRYLAPVRPVQLPRALRGIATGVVGLDTRPVAAAPVVRPDAQPTSGYAPATGTPSGCPEAVAAGGFTPAQYLTAYGYNGLQQSGTIGQGERVALIEIDGFKKSDIATFAQCFHLRLPQVTPFGVGVSRPLPPGGESTLDLEVLDAAAPGLTAIDVYESGPNAADVLRAMTQPLQNPGHKPQVISASLGLCEQDTQASVGTAGILGAESALEEAAASGISFLAASGDDGSADCVSGSSSTSAPVHELAVNYPGSSPWATSVGGTNLALNPDNTISDSTVWNDGAVDPGSAGGGGLSHIFRRPAYQTGTVATNRRAVPDVALLADIAPGYDVYCSAPECIGPSSPRPWQTVGGTSAATPLLAGGLALVDQQLRAHGRQDLGLLNPLLYRIGRTPQLDSAVLQDVINGGNDIGPFIPGWGRPLGCCSAAPGFDMASGWGGVNASALAVAALATRVDVSLALPGGQHPVRSRHVLATASCSGPCQVGVTALVSIRGSRPFDAYSRLYTLLNGGRRQISVGFSRAQLSALRTALRRHRRITATVNATVVDAAGSVTRRNTPSKLLRVNS